MGETTGKAKLYLDSVMLKVEHATVQGMTDVALQILANAQPLTNVDTGFLRNSGFVVSKLTSTYSVAKAEAEATPDKRETQVMAPEPILPNGVLALVGFGANYAIWQEILSGFLMGGATKAAQECGAILTPVFKEWVGE